MDEHILHMEKVTKIYGSGDAAFAALRDVDFEAKTGEMVVVMGPSGAGKTTFLTIAGALLRPTSGTVTVCDTEITSLGEKDLPDIRREYIGFVFQSFNLLESLTAKENVSLVMIDGGRHAVRRAEEILSMLGLGHRLNSLPKNLSGGEKQRVAIARALANNPQLILADEPTANLDSKRGREVMELLERIAYEMNKAVVIVSHDHRTREVADRVVWLEDGTFRSDVVTVRDPVCARVIEQEGAPIVEFEAIVYYFCGENCQKQFEKGPLTYVDAPE
ncbi:MAG TPA: ATP-binding cassette domain-containing protein [Dehalococcoidia bacterium]|nr:ATP-binding cassette domain-containing protein [Dehalococcoidia bacterium]